MKNFVEDLEQVFFCKKCKNKEKVNYNRQPKTFIIDIPTKMTKTTETDSEDNSIRIGKLAGDQSSSIEKRDSGKKLLLYYMLLRASRICSHA